MIRIYRNSFQHTAVNLTHLSVVKPTASLFHPFSLTFWSPQYSPERNPSNTYRIVFPTRLQRDNEYSSIQSQLQHYFHRYAVKQDLDLALRNRTMRHSFLYLSPDTFAFEPIELDLSAIHTISLIPQTRVMCLQHGFTYQIVYSHDPKDAQEEFDAVVDRLQVYYS